jgi:predicted permease
MVVALAAGVAGVLVARGLLAIVLRFAADSVPRLGEVRLDASVLGFTVAVCAFTGLAFGLIPALHMSSARLSHALRRTGRGQDIAGGRLRNVLVTLEVALCVVLLVGSSLLIRSFDRLRGEDPGFSSEGAIAVRFQLPQARYAGTEEQVTALSTIRDRLLALPGVESAGAINALPVVEGAGDTRVHAAKDPPANEGEWRGAPVRTVTAGYFEAMRIPLLRGRTFDARDHETADRTVIINDVFAQQFFGDADPLGEDLVIGISDAFHARIIGVVRAVRSYGLATTPQPEFYLPFPQAPFANGMTFVVRTRSSPAGMIPAIREEVRGFDREQPLTLLAPVDELIAQTIASPRFRTSLLAAFAATALLLAAMGVYGVIAYAVARRTREIGIQLALGARANRVVRTMVARALAFTAVGLALGIAAAWGLTRLLESELYQVPPRDGTAFGAAALVVITVTILASWLPARRAARIDPAVTLRQD